MKGLYPIVVTKIVMGLKMYLMRKTFAFAGSFFLLGTMIAFLGSILLPVIVVFLPDHSLNIKSYKLKKSCLCLKKHQSFLSHRISLMHKDGIDADILAETARSELGLFAPNDVIISIDLSDLKF